MTTDHQQTTITWDQIYLMADALKTEFRTLNPQWFVDDAKNDGPCDLTPWNLLACAAAKVIGEINDER